jgi:acyl-coenzyme A thioesterase PaaI-like protein
MGGRLASKAQIIEFLAASFPQSKCTVEAVGPMSAVIRHQIGVDELRPGGTVSGPVLMATADVGLYVAILAEIGIVPLAVTTSLNINFLRKPSATADILAHCKLIKVGKALAVGEVTLYSEGNPDPVAHAVGTYSIPRHQGAEPQALP